MTPGRRSSRCNAAQSGSGRVHVGVVLGYSRASSSASLIASTAAASSPSARARESTLATFPALTPTEATTCPVASPSASFCRRISLQDMHLGLLRCHPAHLKRGPAGDPRSYVASLPLADAAARQCRGDHERRNRCSRCGGIGVHDAVESVFTMGRRAHASRVRMAAIATDYCRSCLESPRTRPRG